MKIRMLGEGYEGSAVEIVEAMHYRAWGQEDKTLSEYIDWAVEGARRMYGVELVVEGETAEEKARGLVEGMVGAGLAEVVEE